MQYFKKYELFHDGNHVQKPKFILKSEISKHIAKNFVNVKLFFSFLTTIYIQGDLKKIGQNVFN